ncbi:hypothetical protein NDU88_001709, partial [Pleurodeles waltl]
MRNLFKSFFTCVCSRNRYLVVSLFFWEQYPESVQQGERQRQSGIFCHWAETPRA